MPFLIRKSDEEVHSVNCSMWASFPEYADFRSNFVTPIRHIFPYLLFQTCDTNKQTNILSVEYVYFQMINIT